MNKAIYHISGFDCANCAANAENHLNKHPLIQSATIDFNNERLFITFRDEPLTREQIIDTIKEVEDDPIRLEPIKAGKKDKEKLFEKEDYFLLARIIVMVILMVTAKILERPLGERGLAVIILYCSALVIGIYDIIFEVFSNIIHLRNPIDEHLLMSISCIGAFSIAFFKEAEPVFFDGVMVLVLFQIGELIEDILSKKSKEAIRQAVDLRADTANLVYGDKVVQVKPDTLSLKDKIIVRVGEIVPVDGLVVIGHGMLDTSSLTGETMPVEVKEGSHILSGTVLISGSITVEVEKVLADSTINKIMELVENSGEQKSKVDKFITRFARIYTPVVLLIAVAFVLIFGLVTKNWPAALYRGVFVLIIGCPCAIVISVPLAYFAGIGLASKIGVVVKGASHLDQLCDVGVLFLDKTGTLTYGNFEVSKVVSFDYSEEEFMTYLLSAESRSSHPIAKAIILHKNTAELALKQENYEELAGFGTHTNYMGHDIYAGNINLLLSKGIDAKVAEESGTIVYLAVDNKYVGYVVLSDIVRPKAKELIKQLDKLNIRVVLLSGDTENNVRNVAEQVGIKEYWSLLLPQDKVKYVEEAINSKKKKENVLFAGDGINDTPSIIRADVGFAMGGIGSDVAVENADIVIMQDHPLKIYHAIKIARMTRNTAIFNIVFAISVKIAAMVITLCIGEKSSAIPIIDALSDTGLTVLLTINSLLLIYRKVK